MRFIFFSIILYTSTLSGQSCDCDHLLADLEPNLFTTINGTALNVQPGDVICIPAGDYGGIQFENIRGTAAHPVTITNCGGQVRIQELRKSAFIIEESAHVRVLGNGDANTPYGIFIEGAYGAGAAGVNIGKFSTALEIAFMEIQDTSFAGILGKTDPECEDFLSWRRAGYVLSDVTIHDNYIHDTGAEGIYLGYTGGYLVNSNVNCNGETVFGHWLENISVHHNRLENIGWDGIQLNLVRSNGQIYDNTIISYGSRDQPFQNFAFSIGGGSYEIFNNYVENRPGGKGQGIQLLSAQSGSRIYNNVLVRPQFHGIFIHNRHKFQEEDRGYFVANNTIIAPEESGILYNTVITEAEDATLVGTEQGHVPTFFMNNLIVDPGSRHEQFNNWKGFRENFIDFNNRATRDLTRERMATNFFTRRMDTLCLVSAENNDYRPGTDASALVDAGSNLVSEGILFDLNGVSRPYNQLFDIGAYEFEGTLLDTDCLVEEDDSSDESGEATLVYPNPASTTIRFSREVMETVMLQMYSQEGRLVRTTTYTLGQDFYIGNIPKGVYWVRLDFPELSELHKIVIE